MFQKATIIFYLTILFVIGSASADAASELEQAKELVKSCIASGKEAEADDAYQNLAIDFASSPLLSTAVYDIAETYRNSSKFDKSLQVYRDIVTKWPASSQAVWAQRGLAVSNIALGKLTEAQGDLDKLKQVYSADPNIAEAVYNVADAYYWFKNYSEADRLYKYVAAKYPKSIIAMWAQMGLAISSIAQDKDADAEAATQKLLTDYADSEKLSEALFYIAGRYEWSRKYKEAKDIFKQIAEQFPQSGQAGSVPFAVARISVLLAIETGEPASLNAIDNFTSAYGDNPELPGTLVHSIAHRIYDKAFEMEAANLESQSKVYFQKAIEIWEQVTDKHPEHTCTADGYSWAGHCYRQLGQYQKAIDCYSNVAEKFPEYKLAWNALFLVGRCYEDLAESGSIGESEANSKIKKAYQQLIDKYPDCRAARIAEGWLSSHK